MITIKICHSKQININLLQTTTKIIPIKCKRLWVNYIYTWIISGGDNTQDI